MSETVGTAQKPTDFVANHACRHNICTRNFSC